MISRGFRFSAVALCIALQGHTSSNPSGAAVQALQVTSKFQVASVRPGLSPLHATDNLSVAIPTTEDVVTGRGIARRIRENRSTRGRVAIPAETKQKYLVKSRASVTNARSASRTKPKPRRAKGACLPYDSAIKALRAHHAVHGDLVISRRYIVPERKEYPSEWHGVDLASTVYDMKWWQKHVKQNPDRVAELNKLGFVWERLQPEWNLVLEALITYSSLHGNVMVPKSFVVPHGDETWPKATWGIQLGRSVFRIRSRGDYLRGSNAASRRAQLDGLGFVWEVNEYLFRKFHQALLHFAKLERMKSPGGNGLYRALRVPSTFVVPFGQDNGWPEELWGYPLGVKCAAVRQKELYIKNNPERQAALAELGFQWSGNATLGWLEVVHAAAIYSKMHERNLDVPFHFVVPAPPHISSDGNRQSDRGNGIAGSDDAWPWPEQLWGLPLGQRLKDIRLKGAYLTGSAASARRAQLDALGFNWTPKRGRRKRLLGDDTN